MSVLHVSKGCIRKSFGKAEDVVFLPDLLEVQSKSFNDFVQLDFLPEERESKGLERVLRNVFPIEHVNKFSLRYCGYELGDWACVCGALSGIEKRYTWRHEKTGKTGVGRLSLEETKKGKNYIRCGKCHTRVTVRVPFSVEECKYSGRSYAMPIRLKLQLVTWDTDSSGEKAVRDIKEQNVFLCSLPVMIDLYEDSADGRLKLGNNGTFLINGVSRVVVSQIHRAPGVLFSIAKKGTRSVFTGAVYSARIIPARGVWLDFDFDSNGLLCVKIDKKKKLLVSTFLQALGLTRAEILKEFYSFESINVVNSDFFLVVDQNLVGNRLPFDLANLGSAFIQYKKGMRITEGLVKTLQAAKHTQIAIARENLEGKVVSCDIENRKTGEIICQAGDTLTEDVLLQLASMKTCNFTVVAEANAGSMLLMAKTLQDDYIVDNESAVKELYSRIKPGDSPNFSSMKQYVDELLFNARYYDLSSVGRVRINRKLNVNVDPDTTVLNLTDILKTIKYLVNLQEKGEGNIDDVDHLSNRCVRLVDELLQNQMYVGLARIEKIAKEKLRLIENDRSQMPYDFINVKPMVAVLNSFFGTGQLSQFMDQTNPLAEMAHKRRLSALGPGGITRERATLDVRDVHSSHYGRICPIATPDGLNIGLISSLATYARVNDLGFVETAYRPVKNGVVETDPSQIVYLDAYQEFGKYISQASVEMDKQSKIIADSVIARKDGDFVYCSPEELDYIDVSTRQLVSVGTALIPFLENDDANRALMGSNMQRQAVPLIRPKSPLVGTGAEEELGQIPGVTILARHGGVVEYVSSSKIVICVADDQLDTEEWSANPVDVYDLTKFNKSSHNTWVHYTPIVRVGQKVVKGQVVADGPAVEKGELALGNNICVAFMPWNGYNFEDAIVVSKRLVSEDLYTSVHIEEFVVEARDTKLGAEEITRDIPNVSDRELENLDEEGIVKVGTRVFPGDILVAKATLKGDVQVSPEEKLLRAIFGEKSREVRDTSERVQPGIFGTVIDVKVFSRSGVRKDKRYKDTVTKDAAKIEADHKNLIGILNKAFSDKLMAKATEYGVPFSKAYIHDFLGLCAAFGKVTNKEFAAYITLLKKLFEDRLKVLATLKDDKVAGLRKGDELPSGVIKMVRVYVAMKRPISVGDKMAGRHGNKGVVSKVVDIQDMPYMGDGSPVDIVLNPLGVPGRMNLGQVLETMLGMACVKMSKDLAAQVKSGALESAKNYLANYLDKQVVDSLVEAYGHDVLYDVVKLVIENGLPVATPVFDGAKYDADLVPMLKALKLPPTGQYDLFDGKTGEQFSQPVTVGWIYMMKLNHMADDKLHARSVGPYSLITQQPLGGKAQFGGQRLGEMEVWALFAYGAAYALQEMLTIKSDDMMGRSKAYESIIHGEEIPAPGLPESFNVLIKELQSLCLNIDLFKANQECLSE